MFSKDITTSDAFREMPTSSQALYFHLGMEADDDGFLDNYKGLMRAINASEDDLKLLIAKRFLILFPSKIIVVKHWLINNTVRKDRYSETKHLEEKRALLVKENGSYTDDFSGLPNGNQMATQYRIGEDRKEEISEVEDDVRDVSYPLDEELDQTTKRTPNVISSPYSIEGTRGVWVDGSVRLQILNWYFAEAGIWKRATTREKLKAFMYRHSKAAERLEKGGWTFGEIKKARAKFSDNESLNGEWTLETVEKYLTK